MKYEIFLFGDVDVVDLYTYREERNDYTPIVLSALVSKLYSIGYVFRLDDDQLHIDIDTVETVDMEQVESDLLGQSYHLIQDGVMYYVLGVHDEKTGTFKDIVGDDLIVVKQYFNDHNIDVALEMLSIDIEDDTKTIDVRGLRITAMIIRNDCDILNNVSVDDFVEVLKSFGSMTQRGEVIEWESDDFSNLINRVVFRELVGHVPNKKRFEDEVIPTINSIIRKQIINSLERMNDNKRLHLIAHDLPLVDGTDERTIINIAEFNNLVSVLSIVNGYNLAKPELAYYKALNKFVIKIIHDGTKRALLNNRKYLSVCDL